MKIKICNLILSHVIPSSVSVRTRDSTTQSCLKTMAVTTSYFSYCYIIKCQFVSREKVRRNLGESWNISGLCCLSCSRLKGNCVKIKSKLETFGMCDESVGELQTDD